MNIVLDTNVLVAGLLTPYGLCGEIVRMISSNELTLCFDARILAEYNEVLRRPKFKFDENKVAVLLDYLAHHGRTIASHPLPQALPDIDDEPFLEVAIAGKAACLVTGNKLHFPAKQRQGVKVLSPREFSNFYKKQQE
jgi:putative PIN family toxin of toxin-antitoxin system